MIALKKLNIYGCTATMSQDDFTANQGSDWFMVFLQTWNIYEKFSQGIRLL